ncbi:MAG: tetratricopeptide repeat protein [Gammaproteobacteria bacterium]|nr:tetratricopeptide repeat protein [Gammaproteobacteria bacterium]
MYPRKNNPPRAIILLILLACITACSAPPKRLTLRDIDITPAATITHRTGIQPNSEEEIKQAYAEYLKFASKDDKSRLDALHRLAQLEFDLSDKLAKNKGQSNHATDELEDQISSTTLNRTIELLQVSLHDYPNAKDNDQALYQLAKAYDQRGEHDKSMDALAKLVAKYPASPFYVESQFRLAEDAFSAKHYSKAEDIYTDILVSKKNTLFYEKTLYKRGWAKFKQEYYTEAIDDFTKAINLNNFDDYEKLSDSQKQMFDEYFRAVGLSFSYLGGAKSLAEYFAAHPDFKFVYYGYSSLSDIYLKQQRYTDAVATLDYFIKHHPKSIYVPETYLKSIDVWQQGGFTAQVLTTIEALYAGYQPNSPYWAKTMADPGIYRRVKTALKDYIVIAATFLHKEYQQTKKEEAFVSAKKWYERYLEHYQAFSRKDNIQFFYADLLAKHKDFADALQHYELAAYDADIILNKEAAYETIVLTSNLYKNQPSNRHDYLTKIIKYSLLFTQLYPNDPQSAKIIGFAAETAFSNDMYAEAIKLVELAPSNRSADVGMNLDLIKAHSYYKLKQYPQAEAVYTTLLKTTTPDEKTKAQMLDNLSVAIYNQAAAAVVNNKIDAALRDYSRIATIAPTSSIAATGLYDAIALAINKKMWNEAINYSKQFQSLYPNHPQKQDVAKKLSVAYLNSNQDINAATELVKLSRTDQDIQYNTAALWKAAELYESKKDYTAAIDSYAEYVKRFPSPYPQYLEAMFKLTQLITLQNNPRVVGLWRQKILEADKIEQDGNKNERTKYIASTAALALARIEYNDFTNIQLTLPLEQTLRKKKQAMQNAVTLYGRASAYGIAETSTEATHAIGEIYRDFSRSLIESERPKNLKGLEAEQYKNILEDQAFPFEEKAIEFYEANLAHIKDGVYDDWVQKSLARLKELFPARYNREAKLDVYVNALH